MEKTASFQIDHDRLEPGLYVSRRDPRGPNKDWIETTFDLRFKKPNKWDYLDPKAAHSLEHLIATYLRSDERNQDILNKDNVVYVGPMWCFTGMYIVVEWKLTAEEMLPLVREMLTWITNFEGVVPWTAATIECGYVALHDLEGAKKEAAAYLKALENPILEYPENIE